jgi:hypothetical protein
MALQHVGHQFNVNLGWAIGFVAFGSVVAHTAVLLVFQLGQPRIFFSMARDGLLPKTFYKVHKKYRTPYVSTILTGVFVAVFAAVASIDEMVDLTNIGTLFAFILVCIGIMVLRVREPERKRPFKVPGGMIIPALGVISCLYLIYYLPPTSWLRFAAWLNLGFVIYVGYGSVHSKLTGRHNTGDTAAHDVSTAYAGAWLGVIGVAMLFFMRGMDIWIEAAKNQSAGILSQVMSTAPWLDVSWFLVVPLALNGFLLSPIIIRRANAAKRTLTDPAITASATRSIVIASVIAVGTAGYLALIMINAFAQK